MSASASRNQQNTAQTRAVRSERAGRIISAAPQLRRARDTIDIAIAISLCVSWCGGVGQSYEERARSYICHRMRLGLRTLHFVIAILEMSLLVERLRVSRPLMSGVGLANGAIATWPLKAEEGTRSCVLHRKPHM